MEIVWGKLCEAEWNAALPPTACALQQSWRFGAAVSAMGQQVCRARIGCGADTALAQVICRRPAGWLSLGYLPRGPIWHNTPEPPQATAAIRAIRRSLPLPGLKLLLVVPEQPLAGLLTLMTPVHMAELQLSPDIAQMRRSLHGKWRNRLVKAEAAGLTVHCRPPGPDDIRRLAAADLRRQRQRGYRSLPAAFLQAWHAAGPAGALLYSARMGRDSVAEMLFLDHAPGATYQIGWTSGTGRALSAHHLLLWAAISDCAARGRRRLDLGTLDTVNCPGLARFKLGTGAVARALGSSGIWLPMGRLKPRPGRHGVLAGAPR